MAQRVKISDHGRGTILTYEWASQEIDGNRDHIVGHLHDYAGFRGEVKLYRVHYGKTYDQMAPGGAAAYITLWGHRTYLTGSTAYRYKV